MPRINPKDRAAGESVPSGDYVIAMVWFQRRQGKNSGLDYLSCKWEVCAGELKGSKFFAMMALDCTKPGTVKRWQIFCEAAGVEQEFELGDSREGTQHEGDRNIRALFLGAPIVARVKRETRDGYTNNDIELIAFRKNWTPEHLEAMREWEATWRKRAEQAGEPEDAAGDPPEDDWDQRAPEDDEQPQRAGSDQFDDIPF